jgi:hypothetical protein
VSIPSSFACEGKTFVAGKYDLSAFYEPQPNEGTHLQVFKGTRMICEVKGSSTTANSDLAASKVRMLTRLNSQMQCVQIDIVLPSSVRERIHNQVFYLPQPARK